MASLTSRTVPRLLTCLRSTTTLRPAARTPTSPRTITSFQGLQGMVQPWNVANFEAYEEEEEVMEPQLSLHLEAVQRWQEEAQQMQEMRIIPEVLDQSHVSSNEVVLDLMQTLVDEELLDIRRGWVASTNY